VNGVTTLNLRIIAIGVLISAVFWAGAPTLAKRPPYLAVEIDRFVVENGVNFPIDYQVALVEDIIREMKRAFKSVEVLREGEPLPDGKMVLRITGNVIKYKPGSRAKRHLIGFGAGSTVVKAQVKFVDAKSGQVLLDREAQGLTWIGFLGGSSEGASGGLAKKIVGFAKSDQLIEQK
jgi:Domain of unknown function (DUF4410)